MTATFHKVHEEIYREHWLEVYEFVQSGGGSSSFHYYAMIDGWKLPGDFDVRSYHHFVQQTPEPDNMPPPDRSLALAAARAYCDREAEKLQRHGDELLSLTLSYREATTLLLALRVAQLSDPAAKYDLVERIRTLLQEPSVENDLASLPSRAFAKIRGFFKIQ